MKAWMIINGACAVAILAFVGQVWSDKFVSAALPSAKYAILLFTLGVGVAGLSTVMAYFVQLYYHLLIEVQFDPNKAWHTWHKGEMVRYFAIGLVVTSIVLFGLGVYQSLTMLRDYGVSVQTG